MRCTSPCNRSSSRGSFLTACRLTHREVLSAGETARSGSNPPRSFSEGVAVRTKCPTATPRSPARVPCPHPTPDAAVATTPSRASSSSEGIRRQGIYLKIQTSNLETNTPEHSSHQARHACQPQEFFAFCLPLFLHGTQKVHGSAGLRCITAKEKVTHTCVEQPCRCMCAVFLYAKHRTLASAAKPWLRAASSEVKSAATFVFNQQFVLTSENQGHSFSESFSELQFQNLYVT